jgi:hypothetical protein
MDKPLSIKISPSLKWLSPYLTISRVYVPNIDWLKQISSRVPSMSKSHLTLGQITVKDKKRVKITIWTHELSAGIKPLPFSRIHILETLAHELAHLRQLVVAGEGELPHSVKHALFRTHLFEIFLLYLNGTGYLSEEQERQCPATQSQE